MSQKVEKPALQGTRQKNRKRDDCKKYDANVFRDKLIKLIVEAGSELEQVSKAIEAAGSNSSLGLDFREYAEPLFDIIFAGGLLAPGGFVVDDGELSHTDLCAFKCGDGHKALKGYYELLYKLIRRYRYLEKIFDEELKKLINFLKGFKAEERQRLATLLGICLANGLGSPVCLQVVLDVHLVKDGLSLEFFPDVMRAILLEKDAQTMGGVLKKAGLDNRLLELFPINKRSQDNFDNFFKAADLNQVVEYQRQKSTAGVRRETHKQLEQLIRDEQPLKEIIAFLGEQKGKITDQETVIMAWTAIMNAIEWNKKEEIVQDQVLKHLKQYAPLLAALTVNSQPLQIALLQKIQEYCYENMNFTKAFTKIARLLYSGDVLEEDAIMRWYREAHVPKGKSVFLAQMKPFIDWLEKAEEESDEDDDDTKNEKEQKEA